TGPTTVSGGTLQVGNGGTVGSLGSSPVQNDALIIVNRSDAITVNNVISGSGTMQQAGTGTLTLGGANSFAGGLNVNNGFVRLANSTAGGAGAIRVNPGGTLIAGTSIANAITLAGGTVGASAAVTFSGDI